MPNVVRDDINRMVRALKDAKTDDEIDAALNEIFEMLDRDGYADEVTQKENDAIEAGFTMVSEGKPKQDIRTKMLGMLKPPEPAGPPPSRFVTGLRAKVLASRGQGRKKTAKKSKKSRKTKRRTTRRV